METTSIRCLLNSISRFIHLVSSRTIKFISIQEDYKDMVGVLKLLKPVLDDVVDYNIISDDLLYKECEVLDIVVNEAREFIENWGPKTSKICSVLQSDSLLTKIRNSSLDICQILCKSLQSSPSCSSLTAVERCLESLKFFTKKERASEYIREALKTQRDENSQSTGHLEKIVELLCLKSSQELLKESIAVEKVRMHFKCNEANGEKTSQIDQIVAILDSIRDWMARTDQYQGIIQVPIPPYFRCSLSSELMLDPVIVASGQTYDRYSIQKWLDNGLTICPKTHMTLSHTNLTPNYTVKAMIANWCEENSIDLRNLERNFISISSPPMDVSQRDSVQTDSHISLSNSNFTAQSSIEVGNVDEKQTVGISSRLSGENSKDAVKKSYRSSHEQSSIEVGNVDEKQTVGISSRLSGENSKDAIKKGDRSSHERSYAYSRSGSASSAISSIDYVSSALNEEVLRMSNIEDYRSELSGEIVTENSTTYSQHESGIAGQLVGENSKIRKNAADVAENGKDNYKRASSRPNSTVDHDELTTMSHVNDLVVDLKSQRKEVQTNAAEELRLLAKHNMENRVIIGKCGAIRPLISLLYSKVKLTQEHAVTALLNLSIDFNNKAMIADSEAIEPLIHVLKTGNDVARENSAAALYSLSVLEECKAKIGRSAAVRALVDLLGSGSLRGKKDATTALFNLSIFHENKARIVQAGATRYLVEFLDPSTGMVDKAAALLANLSTISEGRSGIAREGGIPLLVELVDVGSLRGKENAASILLQLCLHSSKFCTLILQEGAVPPLVALSQSGTPRAKEKAQQLLSHFRNQREGGSGKGKS